MRSGKAKKSEESSKGKKEQGRVARVVEEEKWEKSGEGWGYL